MSSSYLNFGRILRLGAGKFATRTFLEFEGSRFSYSAFNDQVNVLANWLRGTGLENGDRVLLLAENSPDYVRALFALGKLGVVATPTNAMLTADDIAALVSLTRPRHVLAGPTYVEKLRSALGSSPVPLSVLHGDGRVTAPDGAAVSLLSGPAPEPVPARPIVDEDPGLILFTSGSTGTPKGIVKSYAQIAWSAINHQISEPRRGGDRESFCLALAGIAFANFVLLDALAGVTCVLERRFEPAALADTLTHKGITHIFIAPTMIAAIARSRPGATFPGVRVVETSFEFPLELRKLATAMFPDAQILWSFGSTEAAMARTPPEFLLADVTKVGYAGGLDEFGVADTGEIRTFGPTVMMGYLSSSGVTSSGYVDEDGWFATGDLGRLGENRALHFDGRIKDMIKTGGANVFASEVETALLDHPAVRNAAVVGLPDDYWGEVVAAVLEVDDPARVSLTEIQAWAAGRLAGFRRPKRYFALAELPKNPTGKIAKGQLKDDIARGALPALSSEVDHV